ncbi:hypothetical protein LCGC14_1770910 [marine sediment metagenome]|uniref:Uncharacterized protein n=1 Tax=marine sediment metagenome TaxID=412755 RepID=A0A0F9GYC8_9ZZZZ
MTQYLNPTTMTKEEFLAKHGTRIDENALSGFATEDRSVNCVVVLVDNGMFRAAGIMDGERDLQDFMDPSDMRPRSFYLVKTAAINAEGGVDGYVVK